MKFRVDHLIRGIDLPQYETLYLDEPFNEALCAAVNLGRTLVHFDRQNNKLERQVRVCANREIPGPVAKVLGTNKIEYTEHLSYVFGSFRGIWHTVPGLLADKLESHGSFGFIPHKEGVVRWVEGEVKVHLFGLGGVVERFVLADIEKSYQQAADFTQRWIDNKMRDAATAASL